MYSSSPASRLARELNRSDNERFQGVGVSVVGHQRNKTMEMLFEVMTHLGKIFRPTPMRNVW